MVELAKERPKWARRIIRAAAVALAGLAAACNPLASSPPYQSSLPASAVRHPTPLPSAYTSSAVWVLSPVGINVRSKPDQASDKVATLAQGSKLLVKGSQKTGSQTWVHVRSESGQTDGWVLDDPDLVIHREVKQYSDVQATFATLYPTGWTVEPGNPTTFTAPNGDPEAGIFKIQSSDDPAHLPTLPLSPGKETPSAEPSQPIEVSGVTAFITVYHSDDGGWEYVVEKKIGTHVFLFDLQQAKRPQPDATLFRQLLDSITVSV
jgi:Bacterial SH3 domain